MSTGSERTAPDYWSPQRERQVRRHLATVLGYAEYDGLGSRGVSGVYVGVEITDLERLLHGRTAADQEGERPPWLVAGPGLESG